MIPRFFSDFFSRHLVQRPQQAFSDLLSRYFVRVPRMEMLSGAVLYDRHASDELLRPHGLQIKSESLCSDLSLLALGSEVINRYELEATIIFELSKRLPWWARIVPGLTDALKSAMLKAQMREWLLLELLQTLRLPGTNFKRRYLSAAVFYCSAKLAVQRYDIPLAEVRDWLQRVSTLAKSISENEETLLEALPNDARIAALPEMLAEQFEAEKVDAEMFFSGELFRAAYAIGKAVRMIRSARDSKESRESQHLDRLEGLLSHPGRAIILETSRRLEKFQAFVLEKLREFHPDPNGDELRLRPIAETGEIRSIRTGSLALLALHGPLFWKRAVGRSFDVKEYGFIEEERPRAHLLIDKSPSMLFFGKLFKAGGVLFNRLLCTLEDSADVTFQLFDGTLHQRIEVEGPYEAQKVMSMIRMANFVGSGTDIDQALRRTIAEVKKLPHRTTPDHIVLVTDGAKEVTVTPDECEVIKLHCFILGESNAELRAISQATGGVYQVC